MEFLPLRQSHELHPHGVPAGLADLRDASADHLATGSDEHEFIGVGDGEGSHDKACLVSGLHGDDAFTAAGLLAVLLEGGALADAILSGHE